ncbi:hypothetical protein GFS24_18180 [Chitinophaga sp. SYP-B3965]|uniref:hypothetical protein n=1 Tax=Chitinophaga sp. SYP-B3965 TaxID=2663120 RepID=UPI001299E2AB|nr:hypothetical protein [Chitinophaga sp. SYP-B3965]MRG47057.1 hypothetical protein [Chitinophaga sp. SYP-B3965]
MKTLGCLTVLTITLSACKKKDAPPAPPIDYWLVSSMIKGTDTTHFFYNSNRTIKQVNEANNDSFKVVYENGRIKQFVYLMEYVKGLPFRSFTYSGENIVRINQYGWNLQDQWVILDYDSLVYKNGRLAEYHEISGGIRSRVNKFTWEEKNIIKEEGFDVDQGTDIPAYVNTYTYAAEEGVQHRISGQFLFLYLFRDFTLLSDKMLAKAERARVPGEILFSRTVKDFVLEGKNVVKTTETTEDLDNNQSLTFNTVFEYTKFN